jgi:hypothetical protein
MKRNRLFIVLLAIVTILAMATTALAGKPVDKPDKPGKPPADYVYVTIGLVGNEPGLASICPEALKASEKGSVLHADGESGTSLADLYYRGPGLADGCYTGIAADSKTSGAQFFRVYLTKAGELDHIDWFFDVDVTLVLKKGEPTGRYQVNHKYWLKSLDNWSWSEKGEVTGTFELWDYTREDDEPIWRQLATPTLTFSMDITDIEPAS